MAKLTRKSYQRKAMVVGATAFAGIALVATGFAAWVISSSASKTLDGNVNIGKVSDESIKLEASISSTVKNFSFEPVKDDVSGRVRWDGEHYENLSVTVSGDFSPSKYVNKFSITLRIGTLEEIKNAGTGKTTWETNFEAAAASDKAYIVLPEEVWCKEKVIDVKTLENKTGEGVAADTKKFSYDIAFKWGTAFGGVNPSKYYDENDAGKAVSSDDLKKTMKDFYATMTNTLPEGNNSIPFQVIVTADTSGTAAA